MGDAVVVQGPAGLVALEFADAEGRLEATLARHGVALPPTGPTDGGARLVRYLDGELGAFACCRLQPLGTEFQQRVWQALRCVPPGTTTAYGALARQLGLKPGASRAVGLANGANPIAIAVPCHRVVGAYGSLTGYAGGLRRKAWLLRHEGVPLSPDGRRVEPQASLF